jgi:hypothetical protein
VERTLSGQFSDYRSVIIDGGLRHSFRDRRAVTPLVGVAGGIAIVNEIRHCDLPSAAACGLTARSTVPTIAFLVGVSFPASRHVSVEAESGLRWQARLHAQSAGYDVLLLPDRVTGQRLSIPIAGAVRFRF